MSAAAASSPARSYMTAPSEDASRNFNQHGARLSQPRVNYVSKKGANGVTRNKLGRVSKPKTPEPMIHTDSSPLPYWHSPDLMVTRARPHARSVKDMQPTVENESECSVLSRTPPRQEDKENVSPQLVHKASKRLSPLKPLTGIWQKFTKSPPAPLPAPSRPTSRKTLQRFSESSTMAASTKHRSSGDSWSIFPPAARPLNNLRDLVSGALKFSRVDRLGKPVFVKQGKAIIQSQEPSNEHHGVETIDLPIEEQRIFVSMDKLCEEVAELQEHDELVQREADKLQQEVDTLRSEMQELKAAQQPDSAIGSESDFQQDFEITVRRLHDELSSLQEDNAKLRTTVKAAATRQQDYENVMQANERLHHELSVVYTDVHTLEKELESITFDKAMVYKLTQYNQRLKADVAQLQVTLKSASSLINKSTAICQERDELQHNLTILQQEREDLQHDVANLQQDRDNLNHQLSRYSDERSSLHREKQVLLHEKEDLQRKVEAATSRIQDSTAIVEDRDRLRNHNQQLIGTLENLVKSRDSVQPDLDAASSLLRRSSAFRQEREFHALRQQKRETANNTVATGKKSEMPSENEGNTDMKRVVTIKRPVPVSDRIRAHTSNDADEPTLRPAAAPAKSLAYVIQQTQNELDKLERELVKVTNEYAALDKSENRNGRNGWVALRHRKKVIDDQVKEKSEQLYRLHDVLEGQKAAGQLMTSDETQMSF